MRINTELVHGQCPTCEEMTLLVGISMDAFRCMNCGADLRQYINGKISYLPLISTLPDYKTYLKDWDK